MLFREVQRFIRSHTNQNIDINQRARPNQFVEIIGENIVIDDRKSKQEEKVIN